MRDQYLEDVDAMARERAEAETRQYITDHPEHWDGSEHDLELAAWARNDLTECPSIGIQIAWVDPRRWWQPFLIFNFWQWMGNIGWLVAEDK